MRLINTTTLRQTEFYGSRLSEIRYAILSHCWGEDEVTFEEFIAETHRTGSGWKKIVDCCNLARTQGLEWAWVDTCCIDKRSSAELSEAINSMFKWYQQAEVCYVFLHDLNASLVFRYAVLEAKWSGGEDEPTSAVSRADTQDLPTLNQLGDAVDVRTPQVQALNETNTLLPMHQTSSSVCAEIRIPAPSNVVPFVNGGTSRHEAREPISRFANVQPNLLMPLMQTCRWWTRGWTLQELLAPSHVLFYDKKLEYLGSKSSLADVISTITRIDMEYLLSPETILVACIAQRMSWASTRETTREEDLAYCLLGLFNINMPLLYGEGKAAFTRLQHAIIAQSNDQSIFAWTSDNDDLQGVLAKGPSNFAHSGDIRQKLRAPQCSPYRITNAGLEFYARGALIDDSQFIIALECFLKSPKNPRQLPVAIRLRKTTAASFRYNAKTLTVLSRGALIYRSLIGARNQQYYLGLDSPRRASKQHVAWYRRIVRNERHMMPIILALGLAITAVVVPESKIFTYWTAAIIAWTVATDLKEWVRLTFNKEGAFTVYVSVFLIPAILIHLYIKSAIDHSV